MLENGIKTHFLSVWCLIWWSHSVCSIPGVSVVFCAKMSRNVKSVDWETMNTWRRLSERRLFLSVLAKSFITPSSSCCGGNSTECLSLSLYVTPQADSSTRCLALLWNAYLYEMRCSFSVSHVVSQVSRGQGKFHRRRRRVTFDYQWIISLVSQDSFSFIQQDKDERV